jgi:secreted Zn-dependent insulinase-like peptidase
MIARFRFSTVLLSAALGLIVSACTAEDRRTTQALTLDNALRVILISDMDADTSGAALAVNIGSMADGDFPGIAHFLEHMLFLGTEKYPNPGGYQKYLSEHGGFANAYTAEDHTNYQFQVGPQALKGALDRFAQFFISPLMTDKLSSREVNAVDSEHSKNLENDLWRQRQVFQTLINPEHPRHNFGTGNLETLARVRNEILRGFYAKHYSANRMALCVVGPFPIDTLENWTKSMFAEIKNKRLKPFEVKGRMFTEMAGKTVNVKSVNDIRSVQLHFELDADSFDHAAKPGNIVGSIIGHEGRESLLQNLKDEGWATGLSAGSQQVGPTGTFDISITLTAAGLEQRQAVVERTFGMLNMLRSGGDLPDYLFREAQEMAEIGLRFRQPGRPFAETRTLAAAMMKYPHENLLAHLFLIQKPSQGATRHLLQQLRPDNVVVFVNAIELEADKKEKYYGSEYSVRPFSSSLKTRLTRAMPQGRMGLPAANPFLPEDFKLVTTRHAAEPYVHKFDQGELWLRHDAQFQQPKASLRIDALNGLHQASARDFVLGSLFAEAATEAINPHLYPAVLAGLGVSISSDRAGLTLRVSGYSDRVVELVEFTSPYLTSVRIDEAKFEIICEKQLRILRNKAKQPAQRHAFDIFTQIIREVTWNDAQQIAVLEAVNYADLKDYVERSRQEVYLRGFAYGNLGTDQVRQLAKTLGTSLGGDGVLPVAKRFSYRVVKMAPGTSAVLTKPIDSNESACMLVYQGDPLSEENRAVLRITSQIMNTRFFQDLRTLQQTGYLVHASGMDLEGLPFFYFLSQSSVVAPVSLRGRFQSFLKHFVDDLGKISEEEFERTRGAVIAEVLKKRNSFGEELSWNYNAAFRLKGDFEAESRLAAALKALTLEQYQAAVPAFFADEGVRRVSIEIVGTSDRHRFQPSTLEDLRAGAEGWWERPAR